MHASDAGSGEGGVGGWRLSNRFPAKRRAQCGLESPTQTEIKDAQPAEPRR